MGKIPEKCKLCDETNIANFRTRIINDKLYYVQICKKCERDYDKKYRKENFDIIKAREKIYYDDNKEVIKIKKKAYDKKRYEDKKEIIKSRTAEYALRNKNIINEKRKNKRKNDPVVKFRHYFSDRIRRIIKIGHGKKNGSCIKHLNFTFEQLKEHLEKQFESWMTWENYGIYDPKTWNDYDQASWSWNIDHIIPQSDLPYSSMEDDNFKICWSLTNLRPYSAKQNNLDGAQRTRHKNYGK